MRWLAMNKIGEISELNHKNICCSRTKTNKLFDMPNAHYHNHYEIYYLLSGKRKYFIENKIFELSKGDIILIPKDTLHKTVVHDNSHHQRLLVSFNDNMVPLQHQEEIESCFKRYYYHPPETITHQIDHLFHKIEKEYNNNDKFSEFILKGNLIELFAFLIRNNDKFTLTQPIDETNHFIQSVAQYLCQNFDHHITLISTAKKYNISPEHLSRQFKKNTGYNFNEYLNLVRIQNAEKLLKNKEMSMAEVAFCCGFNDSNYFSTVFKKVVGMSPKKYRG